MANAFAALHLADPVARALVQEGYSTPTPIQAQAMPIILSGRDLLGVAQTGTGKTAAFAAPLLDRLARAPAPTKRRSTRILVLAPTRELARQIADSFIVYGRNLRIHVAAVFGGAPMNKQVKALDRGVDVLVATPGRLIDLVDRGAVTLADVEAFVLDEADQMLDMGFIHSLRKIAPMLPKQRQTLLFSATMPKAIAELARQFLKDPARVEAARVASTAERIRQYGAFVDPSMKLALLARTIVDSKGERMLVFTRTKHGADRVVRNLAAQGLVAAAIHGNKSQPQRERALEAFRSGANPVLVATDIAARGIDVEGVAQVVNYELPNVPEQYVHRIGRTARAGAEGIALSFIAPDERGYLRDIEALTRVRVEIVPLPEDLAPARPAPKFRPEAHKHDGNVKRADHGANRDARRDGRPKKEWSPTKEGPPKKKDRGLDRHGRPGGPRRPSPAANDLAAERGDGERQGQRRPRRPMRRRRAAEGARA